MRRNLGQKVKMTHYDCASAGQCKLDRVEKSIAAAWLIAQYKSLQLMGSLFIYNIIYFISFYRIVEAQFKEF